MRTLLLLPLLGLLAAGCASTSALGDADQAVGPTWQLVSLGDDAADAEATLTFGDDGRVFGTTGRVFGTTGCNRFFGSYDLDADGALTLSQVGSTRMACPPAEMAQETRFLSALNGAQRVTVTGDRMVLVTTGGPQLTFQATAAETTDATLSGTATYRQRIALPPDAVLSAKLLDVSRADAPSVTLAETRVSTGGQVPLPFTLDYDSGDVQPRNRYVVRAEIFDAQGVLLWTTDTAYPVLTNGAPTDDVEIVLAQVTEADQAGALVGRTWRLAEVRQPSGVVLAYEGQAPFTLMFGADGRYNGQADCNRYGGSFEAAPGGTLRLSQGLSTLAACPDPSVSQDFFGVLNAVQRYDLAGGRLTLTGADGGSLVFE